MNSRKYCVYMHKNKINGKVYIGATCLIPKKRWANGKGYSGNKKFYKDIVEYGWDNFEHFIIIDNLDQEQSQILEKFYIQKYKYICYNKSVGGEPRTIKKRKISMELTNEQERDKTYYEKNRDKIIERVKNNQKKNAEKYKEYHRQYYYANEQYHQRKIEYQRKYRQEHKNNKK